MTTITAGLLRPEIPGLSPAPAPSANPIVPNTSGGSGIATYPYVMGPVPAQGIAIGGTLINPASGASAADIATARQAAVEELIREQSQVRKTSPVGYGSNIRNRFYAGLEGLNMSDGKVTLYAVHKSGSKLGGLADDIEGLGDASLTLAAIQGFLQGSGASNLKAGSFVGLLPVSMQSTIKSVSGEVTPIAANIRGGVKQAQANVRAAQAARSSVQPGMVERSQTALLSNIKTGSGMNLGEIGLIGGAGIIALFLFLRRK